MGPLVHGHAGQLVGEFLSVGDFGISGASRGLYPGLPLTGDRRHRIRHLGLPEVVSLTLRKFCVLPHVYTIKHSYIIKKMKNSKCQTYPPKNQKNILSVYFVFQGILNNF